jgi:hypothetical protein
MKIGSTQDKTVERKVLDGVPVIVTPCSFSLSANPGSTRTVRNNFRPSGNGAFRVPWMVSVPTRTSEILFSASSCSN